MGEMSTPRRGRCGLSIRHDMDFFAWLWCSKGVSFLSTWRAFYQQSHEPYGNLVYTKSAFLTLHHHDHQQHLAPQVQHEVHGVLKFL